MERTYDCIGMMSGTSLDGVDLVHAKLTRGKGYSYEILSHHTYPYSPNWQSKLKAAFCDPTQDLTRLDRIYGSYLGQVVQTFRKDFKVGKLDFIASHGHTIFHQPNRKYTLQIGCGKALAKQTACRVIYDFRSQDVALGGQGAPLVPVGDALFFSQYAACLNLGGFANISFQEDGLRKAFDICPVNSVLNALSHQIGLKYDDRGRVAASGKYSTPLLDALNSASFFRKNPPKSLGVEFVEAEVMPLMHATKIETEHLLCTYVEHVAFQISRVLSSLGSSRVLVTGGGAYNRFLMERIQAHTSASLVLPSPELIECKEALIFALLGLLRLEKTPNCLKSVTGASKDHSSGKIALP